MTVLIQFISVCLHQFPLFLSIKISFYSYFCYFLCSFVVNVCISSREGLIKPTTKRQKNNIGGHLFEQKQTACLWYRCLMFVLLDKMMKLSSVWQEMIYRNPWNNQMIEKKQKIRRQKYFLFEGEISVSCTSTCTLKFWRQILSILCNEFAFQIEFDWIPQSIRANKALLIFTAFFLLFV